MCQCQTRCWNLKFIFHNLEIIKLFTKMNLLGNFQTKNFKLRWTNSSKTDFTNCKFSLRKTFEKIPNLEIKCHIPKQNLIPKHIVKTLLFHFAFRHSLCVFLLLLRLLRSLLRDLLRSGEKLSLWILVFDETFRIPLVSLIFGFVNSKDLLVIVFCLNFNSIRSIRFRFIFLRFEVQFQHAYFKYSFNTHIPVTVSTHTFQFGYSFNTHISVVHLKLKMYKLQVNSFLLLSKIRSNQHFLFVNKNFKKSCST